MFLAIVPGWARKTKRSSRQHIGSTLRRRFYRPHIEKLESRVLLNASDQAFLAAAYNHLLDRPINAGGQAAWGSLLEHGASRSEGSAPDLEQFQPPKFVDGFRQSALLENIP